MLKFFHYGNFKSVAWRFQYLLKYYKIQTESNSKTRLMLIYGKSGIFAHKKTIKQFLQLMIEQVWQGGGWMCRKDLPLFCISFSELLYFCVSFFQFTDAFLGRFTNICIFLAVYYVYFIKKSNSVLGTKFS